MMNRSERDVKLDMGDMETGGTLTLPAGKGPFPAALLLQGSGPTDRNSNARVGLHRFTSSITRDLAWQLADAGIASLRYDKRGCGDRSETGLHALVADARAAWGQMASFPEVGGQLLTVGHSEGAIIAMILASEAEDMDDAVAIACGTSPFDQVLLHQMEHILRSRGRFGRRQQALIDAMERVYGMLRQQGDWEKVAAAEVKREMLPVSFALRLMGARRVKTTLGRQLRPRWVLERDEYPLERMPPQCPVLLLYGDRDYQVPPDEGAPLTDLPGVDVVLVPGMNHMLRDNPGPLTPREVTRSLKRNMLPLVADHIIPWMQRGQDKG